MVVRYKAQSIVPNAVLVLSTESAKEFETRRSGFRQTLNPQNVIEETYVDDIARQQWEIERLNRFKTAILNLNLRNALYKVFVEDLGTYDGGEETVAYLDRWFTEPEVKQELSEILAGYNLDVSAIEAEAFRQSVSDWIVIDQLLAAAESARDRALRQLILCREVLGQKRQNKVIDATPAPRIESSRVA